MSVRTRLFNFCTLTMVMVLLVIDWAPAAALDPPPEPTPEPGEEPAWKPYEEKISGPDEFGTPYMPEATTDTDLYGYTWDDSVALDWKDATGGTKLLPPPGWSPDLFFDDGIADPVSLPWSFDFYERQFDQVYVGDNGLLGFDDSVDENLAAFVNLFIPFDYKFPQNIVAPLWTDLVISPTLPTRGVFYDTGVDANGSYAVIEWHQVWRNRDADLGKDLTFEVVLYQDGDILLQYQTLDPLADLTRSTVGIEDGDGVDGLQYMYNPQTPVLASGDAIQINRPALTDRVKAFPLEIDALNTNGESTYRAFVRNSGGPDADIYNLSYVSSDPSWGVGLFEADGITPLSDSAGDPDSTVDTGSLAPGETFTVTVKVHSPETAVAGDQANVTLTFASSDDPLKSRQVILNSAIPTPFAHTYREGQTIYGEFVSPDNRYLAQENQSYTGDAFLIANASSPNHFVIWEKNRQGNPWYTDLEYNMVDSVGQLVYAPRFVHNFAYLTPYRDTRPMAATAPNGNIGLVWVRTWLNLSNLETKRHLYFTLFDPQGNFLYANADPTWYHILDLTPDSAWHSGSDPDVRSFENVRITATEDNRFHLAWVEKHFLSGVAVSTDIGHAVYGAEAVGGAPQTVLAPTHFTSMVLDDQVDYTWPALITYTDPALDSRVMLAYFERDASGASNVHKLVYSLLDTSGATHQSQTDLYTLYAYTGEAEDRERDLDGVQLSDNRVALSWDDLELNEISYVILEHNLSGPAGPTALDNPDGRIGGSPSVIGDQDGHAVLTWMDKKWFERLYFALVDHSGVIIQPMVLRYATLQTTRAIETKPVQGNASYIPWLRITLPLVPR